MVPECSPSPLALLLPTLQMAGEAEEGSVVAAAHASAPAACTLELGLPGKAPGEHHLLATLQALASPAPQLAGDGKKGRQPALAAGGGGTSLFGRWGN